MLVGTGMIVYYVQGDPSKSVVPGVFVSIGVPRNSEMDPRNYRLWVEGRPPDFVLEVASSNSVKQDEQGKPALSSMIGV